VGDDVKSSDLPKAVVLHPEPLQVEVGGHKLEGAVALLAALAKRGPWYK